MTSLVFPPFSGSDPKVVLDYGIGALNPWSLDGVTLNAKYGFALGGSGNKFDPNWGYKPGTSGFMTSTTQLPGAPVAQGTIYCQCDRFALSEDTTLAIANGATFFVDSTGDPAGVGQRTPFLFQDSVPNNQATVFSNQTSGGTQSFMGNFKFNAAATQTPTMLGHLNSNVVPGYQDATFCEIVFTWLGGTYYIYLDGHLVGNGTFASPPTASMFSQMFIGSSAAGTGPFGNHFIKRVQVSTYFCPPVVSACKVALVSDSLEQRWSNHTQPAGTPSSAAQVFAVQTWTNLLLRCNSGANGYGGQYGQSITLGALNSLSLSQLGFYFNCLSACKSGQGWAHNTTGGPASWEFDTGLGDAVIQYSPEILIMVGSVNDPNIGTPPTSIGTDILAKINYMTAGKSGGASWANGVTQYPVKLRKILFFELFSWEVCAPYNTNGFIPLNQQLMSSVQSAIAGVSSNGIPIQYVSVYNAYTKQQNASTFQVGSSPSNTLTAGGDEGPHGSSPNAHEGAIGMMQMAAIIWPYIRNALSGV